MLTNFIHDVVYGDLPHKPSDTVDNRNGYQVIFLNGLYHIVYRCVYAYRNGVFPHHVFNLGYRRGGNHLFQWKHSLQAVFVVDDIDIIDLIQLLSLLAHLFQALRHTPVLVYDHHFSTHQTTGGVFVVLQQVYDVSCLFDVFNVRKNFFLFLFIQLTHQVYGIIRIHVVHKAFGNGFRREYFQEFFTDILIHFHQHVCRRFVIQ